MEKKRYKGIDFLRTIACFGIVMMHMLSKDNNTYSIGSEAATNVIMSFTDFTMLFMTISAFGMSCGYKEKMLAGEVNLVRFYKKRYLRVLPFFAIMVLIDLVMAFSKESLYEAFADLTLTYGLFPNEITVIGVGWFLGTLFAFYFIFPAFCVLIIDKRVAWFSFAICLLLNYVCGTYFQLGRANIVYSFCHFMLGGMIYLYKNQIDKLPWVFTTLLLFLSAAMYYIWGSNTITLMGLSFSFMTFSMGKVGDTVSNNKFISFISNLSMEIYLCHMAIFRGIERLHINTVFGNGPIQYGITVVIVFVGAVCFSYIITCLLKKVGIGLNGSEN